MSFLGMHLKENMEKGSPKRSQKKLRCQKEKPGYVIAELPFDACCVLRGLDGLRICAEVDAKMAPKMDEKSSLGRARTDILTF